MKNAVSYTHWNSSSPFTWSLLLHQYHSGHHPTPTPPSAVHWGVGGGEKDITELEAHALPSQKPTTMHIALLTLIRTPVKRNWLEALKICFPTMAKRNLFDSKLVLYLVSNPMSLYPFHSAVNSLWDVLNKQAVQTEIRKMRGKLLFSFLDSMWRY